MAPTVRWRALGATLADARPLAVALLGVGAALLAGRLLAAKPPDAFRYAGAFLQVFGLATVARGLSKVRRLFGQPSLPAEIGEWFRRLGKAFGRPRHITIQASAAEIKVVVSDADLTVTAAPNATLERWVAVLEGNVDRLRADLKTKAQSLSQDIAEVRESIRKEMGDRRAVDDQTAHTIQEHAIGDLHLQEIGVVWLVLGAIATSIPGELACWIPWLR